jgi:antitoxin HicB
MTTTYPIIIYPCEKGGYVAEIPALKGCLAQGETLPETLQELEIVTAGSKPPPNTDSLYQTPMPFGRSYDQRAIEQAKALSYSVA